MPLLLLLCGNLFLQVDQEGARIELATHSYVMDLLIKGKLLEALDTMTQRIKSIEVLAVQGNYRMAKQLELLPTERPWFTEIS